MAQSPAERRCQETATSPFGLASAIPLTGSYVVGGPTGCPDGSLPSRTVRIPDDNIAVGETLTLCYFSPGRR
ncbi:hypothetical protein GCM10009647_068920 [Streptomyces sanglieri]